MFNRYTNDFLFYMFLKCNYLYNYLFSNKIFWLKYTQVLMYFWKRNIYIYISIFLL